MLGQMTGLASDTSVKITLELVYQTHFYGVEGPIAGVLMQQPKQEFVFQISFTWA